MALKDQLRENWRKMPDLYKVVALYLFMVSVQCGIVAFFLFPSWWWNCR